MTAEPLPDARERIVVGVDGSEPSKNALLWARSLAQSTDSAILVVGAWQQYASYGYPDAGWSAMPESWDPEGDAEKSVIGTVDAVFGAHRPLRLEIVMREGSTAKVLLDASPDARMLVVGSRGLGGFSGLLLGSVSAACAAHANCPVLVLHGMTPPPTLQKEPT